MMQKMANDSKFADDLKASVVSLQNATRDMDVKLNAMNVTVRLMESSNRTIARLESDIKLCLHKSE